MASKKRKAVNAAMRDRTGRWKARQKELSQGPTLEDIRRRLGMTPKVSKGPWSS